MMRILYTVTEQIDNHNASKLEKARQLEQIREIKRKEMEKKEHERKEKLNAKKKEIKGGKKGNNGGANKDEGKEERGGVRFGKGIKGSKEGRVSKDDNKRKKKVAFA